MKRLIFRLGIGCLLLMLLASCVSSLRRVSLRSWQVESLAPYGLTKWDVRIRLGLDNPVREFTVRDITGTLKLRGEAIADLTADDLTIARQEGGEYPLLVHLSLRGGLGGLLAGGLLSGGLQQEDVTLDVAALVEMRGGERRKLQFKDLSLKDLPRDAAAGVPASVTAVRL